LVLQVLDGAGDSAENSVLLLKIEKPAVSPSGSEGGLFYLTAGLRRSPFSLCNRFPTAAVGACPLASIRSPSDLLRSEMATTGIKGFGKGCCRRTKAGAGWRFGKYFAFIRQL
jgi:hypothetical protein